MTRRPALLLVALLAIVATLMAVLHPAMASPPPPGQDSYVKTFTGALSGGTAIINSSTGKRIVLDGMIVRASAAGVLVLADGTSGTTLANIYLAQDTNYEIRPEFFGGDGLRTTAGNALDATMSTNTITCLMRMHYE